MNTVATGAFAKVAFFAKEAFAARASGAFAKEAFTAKAYATDQMWHPLPPPGDVWQERPPDGDVWTKQGVVGTSWRRA